MKQMFPIVRKINSQLIGDDIVGVRPDEKMVDSIRRFILEQRNKKIEKILNKKGGS